MKILRGIEKSYPYDPTRHFDFERFSDFCPDFSLIEGFIDFQRFSQIAAGPVVYLEFEEPNRFLVADPNFNHFPYENLLTKVLTICPYTAKWMNRRDSNDKRTAIFFPFNENYITLNAPKEFDVVYSGHIHSTQISEMVDALLPHNYCLISGTAGMPPGLVTHPGVGYAEKISLIAKSKISIVHNLLYPNASHIAQALEIDGILDNEAFKQVKAGNKHPVMPQLKSRLFEAAFGKSLIVCQKDDWNIIEQFFEPDIEFLYYESGKLSDTLRAVLQDFDRYMPIAQRAFDRANKEYTTKAFADRYLFNMLRA